MAAPAFRPAFLDVGFTWRSLREPLTRAWAEVMENGSYIGGPALSRFEAEFAAFCESRHCVGVGNGLEALALPLEASGIGPGDEVIVPAHTFIATWAAVARSGARIVPVDADPVTMNMDLSLIEAAITPRTRVIILVHLYGLPIPCAELRQLADARGILLIEDAAQAHGARAEGRRIGSLGHAAAFSFYPGKNLGAFGDGGALVTDDPELARKVRSLGNYGSEQKYDHREIGGNSRLDPLQAAFLSVKLTRLSEWNARRREIAEVYSEELAGQNALRLPKPAPDTDPVWHLYVIRHPRRDALQTALAAKGITAMLHYPQPIHRSGAFRASHGDLPLPMTEEICATCLSLPIGPHLEVDEARAIAAHLRQALREV